MSFYALILLGQHDFGKLRSSAEDENYIVEAIDKYGCNFMATIGVAELLTGYIFNKNDVYDIWEETGELLINNPFKNEKEKIVYVVDRNDSTVYDRNELLRLALKKINDNSFSISYNKFNTNDILTNTRIGFYKKDSSGKYYIYHYAVGDKDGNVVANPGFSISPMKKTDNMFIGEN